MKTNISLILLLIITIFISNAYTADLDNNCYTLASRSPFQSKGVSGERAIEIIREALADIGFDPSRTQQISILSTDLETLDQLIVPSLKIFNADQNRSEINFLDAGSGCGIVPLYFALRFGIKSVGVELDDEQHEIAVKLKKHIVTRGFLDEDIVDFENDNISNIDFGKFQLIYYHSPLVDEVDKMVNDKIVQELQEGAQFIDTLGRTYDMEKGDSFSMEELHSEPDLGDIFNITLLYAHVYTRESSPVRDLDIGV